MITTHSLDPAVFDALAEGGGGPDAIAALHQVVFSRNRTLIKGLLARWPQPWTERDAVLELLDRCQLADPARHATVLGAPLVGAWAAIANRATLRGAATEADFGHLAAITAVACAETGVDAVLRIPARHGKVALPGRGVAQIDAVETRASVSIMDGQLVVHDGPSFTRASAEDGPRWAAVRVLDADAGGHHISLGLDDVDPYRHGHHAPPAARLSIDEVDQWRGLLDRAWALLSGHAPERASELAAGLRTLVPLVGDGRSARSATLRHAFGMFGLTRPHSPADFAVTLVHEFQHSKLSALLDLEPLTDPADQRRFFAPWRTDPRPLAGMLQGVYAFVGVADTWRRLRAAEEYEALAEAQFAETRLQVDLGLSAVEASNALTPAGERLVVGLRRATNVLLADSVSAEAARRATEALRRTQEQWMARNGLVA
jgi:HEXXH motif-containing protein